eukprot:48356-Lingulodinium_polyedra.AAC.1
MPPRRRHGAGSDLYLQKCKMDGWSLGPSSLQELLRYPTKHVETLMGAPASGNGGGKTFRLQRNFMHHGLEVSSDFSGHMCSEDS